MYPVGSNGAGQAILDAAQLTRCIIESDDAVCALKQYDHVRRAATSRIVLADRAGGPDCILNEIERITSGQKVSEEIYQRHRDTLQTLLYEYRSVSSLN
jgi:2-polyprenyl-6-methoxyphenol hydroxylase-like FAD-dependent oxidoreductase